MNKKNNNNEKKEYNETLPKTLQNFFNPLNELIQLNQVQSARPPFVKSLNLLKGTQHDKGVLNITLLPKGILNACQNYYLRPLKQIIQQIFLS